MAERIRTGGVSVNGGAPYGPDLPFGGFKHSGIGRQNGKPGFEQYLEVESISYPAGWPESRGTPDMTIAATGLYYDPYDFDIDADPIHCGSGCATRRRSTGTTSTSSSR